MQDLKIWRQSKLFMGHISYTILIRVELKVTFMNTKRCSLCSFTEYVYSKSLTLISHSLMYMHVIFGLGLWPVGCANILIRHYRLKPMRCRWCHITTLIALIRVIKARHLAKASCVSLPDVIFSCRLLHRAMFPSSASMCAGVCWHQDNCVHLPWESRRHTLCYSA